MQQVCTCVECHLKNIFLDSFETEQYETYCTQKIETSYEKGELIIEQGDEIKDFMYLKSGLVKLYKTNDFGKDQIITIAKPFDFVSLLSIFSNTHYNYSVMALEDSVICSMNLGILKKVALENGLFSSNLIQRVSAAFDMIILETLDIRDLHLRGKLAYVLLKFSNKIYHNNVFDLPVSRREIAEYIGMTTENVIRTFSEFRKDKLIRINGKEIEILEPETLEKLSRLG